MTSGTRPRKLGELLHPEAKVTLGGELAATDVDEALADLDRELVGLLPVHRFGYLEKRHPVHAMRDALIGELSDISRRIRSVSSIPPRAAPLFIDEAYFCIVRPIQRITVGNASIYYSG